MFRGPEKKHTACITTYLNISCTKQDKNTENTKTRYIQKYAE